MGELRHWWTGGRASLVPRQPPVLLAIVVLVAALACTAPSRDGAPAGAASSAAAGAVGAPAAAPTPAPLRARYAYTALAGSMAPLWIAYDQGLFTKYGIEPELAYVPSIQTIQSVLAGDTDFGLMSGRTSVEARLAGGDAVMVGQYSNKVLHALYGLPSIGSVADLRDKRVAITRFGTIVDNSARTLLRGGGLTPPDDVALIQLGGFPEILAGLQVGAVEGALLSPPTTLTARKAGYRELARMQDLPNQYPFAVLVSRRAHVDANPEVTMRTARAMAEATWRMRNDREGSLAALASYLRTDDTEVLEETYRLSSAVLDLTFAATPEGIESVFAEIAVENPAVRQLTLADVFDTRWSDTLASERFLEGLR